MDKTVRCSICRSEFTEEELKTATVCPKCGTKSVPQNINQDITVKINWHELRILGTWAERYANQIENDCKGSVEYVWAICKRLQDQYPEFAPLTLSAELGLLKEEYNNMEVIGNIKQGAPLPPKAN